MSTNSFLSLAKEFKKRNNPYDLKEGKTAVVISLEPLTVSLQNGAITLTLGEELFLTETFKLRCDIDKTSVLSSAVPSFTDNAESVTETHSYTGASCVMPSAISALASAILGVRDELINLKCNLNVGDLVLLVPSENNGIYYLVDKLYIESE